MMYYFRAHYANPSLKLSLERAIELDHRADIKASDGNGDDVAYTPSAAATKLKEKFSEDFYRQPVLTARAGRPLPYRRKDGADELTKIAWSKLDGETSRYQRMLDEKKPAPLADLGQQRNKILVSDGLMFTALWWITILLTRNLIVVVLETVRTLIEGQSKFHLGPEKLCRTCSTICIGYYVVDLK